MAWVIILSLFVCVYPANVYAKALWVYGGNSVDTLERATGMSSGGNGLASSGWKNAQLHVNQVNDVDVGWSSFGVIAARSSYSRESWALIGTGEIFGGATNALPFDARIRSGWLWVYVEQAELPPAMAVAGLAPDQGDWAKGAVSWSYKNTDENTPWRYSGKRGPDIVKEYGQFTPVEMTGWFRVPINLTNALDDIRSGTIGGLLLVPVDLEKQQISTWYAVSDASPESRQRPGMYIEYDSSGAVYTNFFIAHAGQIPVPPYTNLECAASNIQSAVSLATADSTLHFSSGTYGGNAWCGSLGYTWQAQDPVTMTGQVAGTGSLQLHGPYTLGVDGVISSAWLRVAGGSLTVDGYIYADTGIDVEADTALDGAGILQVGAEDRHIYIADGATFSPGASMSILGSLSVDGSWMVSERHLTRSSSGVEIRDRLKLNGSSELYVEDVPDSGGTYQIAQVGTWSGHFSQYDIPFSHTLQYDQDGLILKPGEGGELGEVEVGREGGLVTVALEIADSVGWVAASTCSWITVISGRSGTGDGMVKLEIAENEGRGRNGSVWIAGMEYRVFQRSNKACYLDYDGDGIADVATFWPDEGLWTILESSTGQERIQAWGWSECEPVAGDFDGDGKYDVAVYYPRDGMWYILESSTLQCRIQAWGYSDATPATGDYDGDGISDIAVYDARRGYWSVLESSTGALLKQPWGWEDAQAVAGDYDGDALEDFAVYWPENGLWFILNSSDGTGRIQPWGYTGTEPCQGDFDGDRVTDVAIYWPELGGWNILLSASGEQMLGWWGWNQAFTQPADYDGDSLYDITVYWPDGHYWYTWMSASQTARIFQQKLSDE